MAQTRDNPMAENYMASQNTQKPNASTEGEPGARKGMVPTQSGGREARCQSLPGAIPPYRRPRSWKRAGRSLGGFWGAVRSVSGRWNVRWTEKLDESPQVSVPGPSGAAPIMDPPKLPPKPSYLAGRIPVGSELIRSRPGTFRCGEAPRWTLFVY